MTVYLIGAAVLFVVGVYFYAKREGRKDVTLDHLEVGNELANEVMEKDLKTDETIEKKVSHFRGVMAPNFWRVRGRDSSKKS
tara:strand:- start:3275 stop:3520 length:246 start_codon:yes stop_codon:yes gene_type:complete